MIKQLRSALFIMIFFIFFTGLVYPLFITGVSQVLFSQQANGSLIEKDDQTIGSELIGQQFDQPQYFWGRLSATSGVAYNASASGGSNFSVLNPNLENQVQLRLTALKEAEPDNTQPIPVDLVTSSASGLDPNISVASAEVQAARIAEARGLTLEQVHALIQNYTHNRLLGILGEKTINVLEINLALDEIQ
jgi:potassium-transporting ATPase KdpC subunit